MEGETLNKGDEGVLTKGERRGTILTCFTHINVSCIH